MHRFFLCLPLLAASALPVFAAPVLTLDPVSGITLPGAPGSTVGWGFTITNDTNSYLVVTQLTPSGFTNSSAIMDYIAALNFYVVSPNSPLSVTFDAGTTQGVAGYALDAGAVPGIVDSGTFLINYDLLVNDPNGAGGPDVGDLFGLSFDPVKASVTAGQEIPEPGTFLTTVALGVALAGWARVRRRV